MIGQHIYSRCSEGYFSDDKRTTDSTTLTMSLGLFSQEKDARTVAKFCEKNAALSDNRPVSVVDASGTRGILRIRRVGNQKITVVCRSYRIRPDQDITTYLARGENREFSFASSFILTGEERRLFLEEPGYMLNTSNFETCGSVVKRIRENVERMGRYKIEADPSYSMFNGEVRKPSVMLMKKVGFFNRDTFAMYISSILQAITYSRIRGHEMAQVLVELPKMYNQDWESCGGNQFAEEILVSTMKVLPSFVSEYLNAMTCGRMEYSVEFGSYQLIFVSSLPDRQGSRGENYMINLNNGECIVPEKPDLRYGYFLWDHLEDEEARRKVEEVYTDVIGEDKMACAEFFPGYFELILDLMEKRAGGYANAQERKYLFLGLCSIFEQGDWTQGGLRYIQEILEAEANDPVYEPQTEKILLEIVQGNEWPEEIHKAAIRCLVHYFLYGSDSQETVQWMCHGLEIMDAPLEQEILKACDQIEADQSVRWHEKENIRNFFVLICRDAGISTESEVKSRILGLLVKWYEFFLRNEDWNNFNIILNIITEQLQNRQLGANARQKIYDNLMELLIFGNEKVGESVDAILSREEEAGIKDLTKFEMLWNSFSERILRAQTIITLHSFFHMVYFAVFSSREFLLSEWSDCYSGIVETFTPAQQEMLFNGTYQAIAKWMRHVDKSVNLQETICIVTEKNLECRKAVFYKNPDTLMEILNLYPVNRIREKAMAVTQMYERTTMENRSAYYAALHEELRWWLLAYSVASGRADSTIQNLLLNNFGVRKLLLEKAAELHPDNQEQAALQGMYLKMMENEFRAEIAKAPDKALSIWIDLLLKECRQIAELKWCESLRPQIISYVVKEIASLNPDNIDQLSPQQVISFVNMVGRDNLRAELSKDWNALLILEQLYLLKSNDGISICQELHKQISRESSGRRMEAFRKAINYKRSQMAKEQPKAMGSGYLIYCLDLMRIWMNSANGQRLPDMEAECRWIFDVSGTEQRVKVDCALVDVLVEYNELAGTPFVNMLLNCIGNDLVKLAQTEPDCFEDEKVFKAYRTLPDYFKQNLYEAGFHDALKKIDPEILKRYIQGLTRRQPQRGGMSSGSEMEDEGSWLIPGIIIGLVAVLCIAAEVFLGGAIVELVNLSVTMIIGMVLMGVGVLASIVTAVLMLLS